jgi:valyl-tRNA synthetase
MRSFQRARIRKAFNVRTVLLKAAGNVFGRCFNVKFKISSWPVPVPEHTDKEAAADMKLLVELIRSVRNIRSEVNTPMSKQVELYIKTSTEDIAGRLETLYPYAPAPEPAKS